MMRLNENRKSDIASFWRSIVPDYDGILKLKQIRKEKERNKKRRARGIPEEKWPELDKNYWTGRLICWAKEHVKEYKDLTLKKFNQLSARDTYLICWDFLHFEKNVAERQLGFYEPAITIICEIIDDTQKLYDPETDMEFESEEEYTAYYVSGERDKRLEEIYGPEYYDEEEAIFENLRQEAYSQNEYYL